VIGVALDEAPDDVRPWVDGVTFPVLLDREHVLADLYAVSNVPTVVWIDEHGRIARPNTVAFGTDTFKDFTGIEAAPHLDAIRRWARTGELEAVPDGAGVGDLSPEEEQARLWFRVAAHLRRTGREEQAIERFARAVELAPLDFTIARAAMPLTGGDPFGPAFFDLYERWQQAGSPYHGLGADD
jgi:hypothetical protein